MVACCGSQWDKSSSCTVVSRLARDCYLVWTSNRTFTRNCSVQGCNQKNILGLWIFSCFPLIFDCFPLVLAVFHWYLAVSHWFLSVFHWSLPVFHWFLACFYECLGFYDRNGFFWEVRTQNPPKYDHGSVPMICLLSLFCDVWNFTRAPSPNV